MQKLLPVFLLIICCLSSYAQTTNIQGSIKDTTGQPVITANVALLKAPDSSCVASAITQDDGKFLFDKVVAGNYIVMVNAIGYYKWSKPITTMKGQNYDLNILLKASGQSLKEVVVSAKKPFIEAGLGKTVINVENAISSTGTNALEVLKKSPGVTVDNNGTIGLNGQKGVLLLIDDMKTYLSGDQLLDYLKNMSSDEIAQLELITQPDARYDADGRSGIINIKTKKIKKQGFNGSGTITYEQSIYGHTSENLLLNYRKNRWTFTTNGSYLIAHGFVYANNTKNYRDETTDDILGNFSQRATMNEVFSNSSLKLGMDYALNDKINIGVNVNGVYHPNTNRQHSETLIKDNTTNDVINDITDNHGDFIRKYGLANAYMDYAINKESSLRINMDYMYRNEQDHQHSDNNNYDANGNPLPNDLYLDGDLPSVISVYTANADYSIKTKQGFKIDAGAKANIAKSDDNAIYTVLNNNAWVYDSSISNHYLYSENVNALYCNVDKSFGKKWEAQAGLRMENANATGNQLVGAHTVTSHNTSLFPTAYVMYKANDDNQLEINYGKRIDRPDYRYMNAFREYTSQYSYAVRRPDLLPEYTNNVELKHVYKHALVTTLKYSHTANGITSFYVQDNNTKVSYSSVENLKNTNSVSASVNYNKDIYKWWNLSVSGYWYYTGYDGVLNSKAVNVTGTGYGINNTSQFTIGKGWSAEYAVYYSGASINSVMQNAAPNIYTEVSVAKKVMNDSGTIKLNICDPFYVCRYTEYNRAPGVDAMTYNRWPTQSVAISFNYNFGKMMDNLRERQANMPEEAKRLGM